mmetsp:Transcript_1622/g.4871  ORF Transcript_1622/g.4871 Transcript_1622/m.4871 type:complete len:505 (+) Transcript_1622:160-1674(+)
MRNLGPKRWVWGGLGEGEGEMEDRRDMLEWGESLEETELLDRATQRYLQCYVHDVSSERGYFISLDNNAREGRWVEKALVFARQIVPPDEPTPLEVGRNVEVRENTQEDSVAWLTGRIVGEIDGFYHVEFPDGTDEVVEYERLREQSVRTPTDYVKEIVGVPEGVRHDILHTSDALHELAQDLQLCEIKLDFSGETIEMIGPKTAMEAARQALSVHLNRVRRFAQLSGIRQALTQQWQDANDMRENACELVFEVDHDVIGSCIGKAGVNLKKAHKIPGIVSVKVTDFKTDDGAQRHRFNIVSRDRNAAEAAREVLEYVRVKIFVTPDEIGPVIGKKGVHLREIEQKTGVSKFVLVEDPNKQQPPFFETVGTRKGVETAKKLFNMHRNYLLKNRQMEDDIRALKKNLAQIGLNGNGSSDAENGPGVEVKEVYVDDNVVSMTGHKSASHVRKSSGFAILTSTNPTKGEVQYNGNYTASSLKKASSSNAVRVARQQRIRNAQSQQQR